MSRVLRLVLVSSDERLRSFLSTSLQTEGHELTIVATPAEALEPLNRATRPFDGLLLDMARQPADQGYMLESALNRFGKQRLWLLAPLGVAAWNREATRLGINQLVQGTLQKHDVDTILSQLSLHTAGCWTSTEEADYNTIGEATCMIEELPQGRYFLAASAAMKKIYSTIRLLAPVDVPVLLLGESGVGKDVAACLLHRHSLRADEPYIGVNCAALPTELLESELFGYEAGAFTGALKAKPGKFELAHKGTLLLDEIGEMPAQMQAKLLHVLQDGQFSRLGSRTSTQVDVRVVAATNINIETAIADNTFREDLFYRISAFTITIPPLRDRREEIPYLAEEMMRRLARRYQKDPVYLSPTLMSMLQEYDWPGNLRELSNVLTRIGILQDTTCTIHDLSAKLALGKHKLSCAGSAHDGEVKPSVEDMRTIVRNFKDQTESRLIQKALDASRWNRRHAAADLHISYRALLYKIQQYNLQDAGRALPQPSLH